MYDKSIMELCASFAKVSSRSGVIGGPFGAAIVKDGKLICTSVNTVLSSSDPTCHAEVNAIRKASTILGTYDLSDCELYATGFPCPMCLGAIMWAGIKKIYVSGLPEDAERIGFKDKFIYEYIDKLNNSCYNKDVLEVECHDRDLAVTLYTQYKDSNNTIY